jgi:AbrB family looped-hinge helix DNA binding protein
MNVIMNGFSTITQKGQVAIPKQIRDQLNLKPFDRVRFTLKDGKIIAEPASSIDDMLGVISTKKVVSKKAYKETVKKQVLKKYAHRS